MGNTTGSHLHRARTKFHWLHALLAVGWAALLAACSPTAMVVGYAQPAPPAELQVKEYALVEQSKDNPDHASFLEYIPQEAAHRGAAQTSLDALPVERLASIGPGAPDIDAARQQDDPEGVILRQTIAGEPFSIYTRNGLTHLSYAGRELPNVYDQVVSGAEPGSELFAPAGKQNLVWFYALRDGLWHYVEAGVYREIPTLP